MRTVVMTASGGMGALVADMAAGTSLELVPVTVKLSGLPELSGNPVDIGPIAQQPDTTKLAYLTSVVESAARPDVLLLILTPLANDFPDIGEEILRVLPTWTAQGVTVVIAYMASEIRLPDELETRLRRAGAAVIAQPPRAVAALAALAARRASSTLSTGKPIAARQPEQKLPEDAFDLLALHGMVLPQQAAAHSAEAAVAIGDRIGYPVVAKIESDAVAHRTQLGGVIVGIRNAVELQAAYATLDTRFSEHIRGGTGYVLVQQQNVGEEFLIGIVTDPEFGPVLTIGSGGVTAELDKDMVFLPLPCAPGEIEAAVRTLRRYPLFTGYRNLPPLNLRALLSAVDALVAAYDAEPGITEIEVNPLMIDGARACAVDVLIG
ncbi:MULTISPECIES: acetate--CoA ligase family protein [unclassified Rhodococcus (in: high G+C Gram-positive bacteria)]|uniref:acetate--CoA ligase family protein n=1 Tax=unclassified Rhodococcus (in: high G+C Gram-positive bacteria) TaxID=192944 RepID=UPI00163A9630|nr:MULTISPECIES: acetate--CoA ligase family protein [unclassified Rhodococcus (in: high G+C Gram-positive bacteria)]MBC2637577.1 acetate--CoA ligase family protein [Rhodococcus sp. 3A]MBC2644286.1 acetate--CoA ligase family protein [Rhodococcus sp. 3A]MBC2890978.1 acetate--CoA ligase family protein [Rhodococcus sp. 4CII]MBC2897677.1 acetate--CoA ligase family protein [Rhodococcus sp. 4CII]